MELFTTRQMVLFVIALLCGGVLTAWGTVRVVQKYVLEDLGDPLAKQGGLAPAQAVGQRK